MAIIKILGIRDRIVTTRQKALELIKMVDNHEVSGDTPFVVENRLFRKRQVEYIDPEIDGNEDKKHNEKLKSSDDYYSEMNEDFVKEVKRIKGMTLDQRADLTKGAEMVYEATTFEKPPKEWIVDVRNAQMAFLRQNPTYLVADPTCWKDLVPKSTKLVPSVDARSVLPARILRIVLESIKNTNHMAKRV